MKLRDIEKCIKTLDRYKLDPNNNLYPDIMEIIRLLEIERLLRLKQRRDMKENIAESKHFYY